MVRTIVFLLIGVALRYLNLIINKVKKQALKIMKMEVPFLFVAFSASISFVVVSYCREEKMIVRRAKEEEQKRI
jgi:hypothetical protein